jgi:hypothetical protein
VVEITGAASNRTVKIAARVICIPDRAINRDCNASRSAKSRKFVLVNIEGEHTSEVQYLRADQPCGELKVIQPRWGGVMYEIDHAGDQFFIRTNVNAQDFRMMIASEINPEAASWKEIIPQRRDIILAISRHSKLSSLWRSKTKLEQRSAYLVSPMPAKSPCRIHLVSASHRFPSITTMKLMSNLPLPSCASASADRCIRPGWQLQCSSESGGRFVYSKPWRIGSDLEQHASRLAEVNRAEVSESTPSIAFLIAAPLSRSSSDK